MPLYDRSKQKGPTAKEQANWERLAEAELERQRKLRKQEAEGRRVGDHTRRQSILDQFRR